MPPLTELGKMTGTVEAMTQPVTVYDDAQAAITESAAVAIAQAAAPTNIFGVLQDANPGVQKLADFAWLITITYRVRTPRKLTEQGLNTWRYNLKLRAKPKILRWAPEIGVYPSNAVSSKGILKWQATGTTTMQGMDVLINPPPVNASGTLMISTSSFTSAFVAVLSGLVGTQNNLSIVGYQPKEVFVVTIDTQMVDDDRVQMSVGWSIGSLVTGEVRGDLGGISYGPFDYVQEVDKKEIERTNLAMSLAPKSVHVHQVWPLANHFAGGLVPPS